MLAQLSTNFKCPIPSLPNPTPTEIRHENQLHSTSIALAKTQDIIGYMQVYDTECGNSMNVIPTISFTPCFRLAITFLGKAKTSANKNQLRENDDKLRNQ